MSLASEKGDSILQPAMTCRNASAFLLLGLGMLGLPIVAPEITAAHSVIGASTRELWLLFMGTLNASLGAGGLGWHAMKRIGSIPVWITPANKATVELRPALRTPVRAG